AEIDFDRGLLPLSRRGRPLDTSARRPEPAKDPARKLPHPTLSFGSEPPPNPPAQRLRQILESQPADLRPSRHQEHFLVARFCSDAAKVEDLLHFNPAIGDLDLETFVFFERDRTSIPISHTQ